MKKKPVAPKQTKSIFVIMPFTKSPTRNQGQMTAFYSDQLKTPIERGRFNYAYKVNRSDDSFNITDQIIRDLFSADIVICDLSGTESNPNVMYELGIRLAFSIKPVILIREKHVDNKTIFDITGFYAHPYDPLDYAALVKHIREKIKKLETGEDKYASPVLKITQEETPLAQRISRHRAKVLLDSMEASIKVVRKLFASDVVSYANSAGCSIDFGDKVDELISIIQANSSAFGKLDWSKFRWQFGSQPTIDYYLSNQYLNDLLDENTAVIFTSFLIKYHAHFFSTNYFQGDWHAPFVHSFLGETVIFVNLLNIIKARLFEEDAQKQEKLNLSLKNLYELSHL